MMKSPVINISEKYKFLSEEINNLSEIFERDGRTIKKSRNVIKELEWQGISVCIKSFKRPTIANQFIYTYFRMGKAKRSFSYANRLLDMGINTPEPIAYVEQFNRLGWLSASYYICICEPYLLRFCDLKDSDLLPDEKQKITHNWLHISIVIFIRNIF